MKQTSGLPELILAALILSAAGGLPEASGPDVKNYWHTPTATTATAPHEWSELERGLTPESCAQCHIGQFEQWRESRHAQAFSPGVVGQFPDLGTVESNSCLNCHAPLTEQKLSVPGEADEAVQQLLNSLRSPPPATSTNSPVTTLRHAGVTCAACHIRNWQRFGPPPTRTQATGHIDAPAHNGFTASSFFEDSQFCASCHQFPSSYAINGKPLENTLHEWQQSRFAQEGVQCQGCHMPDRKHQFKGIHDPDMVKKGLGFHTNVTTESASLEIHSKWIGHAFPTYVTPLIEVTIESLDAHGTGLTHQNWQIGRRVAYQQGWVELSDTRIMPEEHRTYTLSALPKQAVTVRFTVDVKPDAFYKGVYRDLLTQDMSPQPRQLIEMAQVLTRRNDYRLYEQSKEINHATH